jgi:hypothetical protein
MANRRHQCRVGEGDLDMHIGSVGQQQSLFRMMMERMVIGAATRNIRSSGGNSRVQSLSGNLHRQAADAYGQHNQPPQPH